MKKIATYHRISTGESVDVFFDRKTKLFLGNNGYAPRKTLKSFKENAKINRKDWKKVLN